MKLNPRNTLSASLVAAACLFAASGALAGATIFNGGGTAATGTIALGMNNDGSLNTPDGSVTVNTSPARTGVAFKFPDGLYRDGTASGCFCEGWGVSTSSFGGNTGFANVSSDSGPNNLTIGPFVSGPSSAVSSVVLTSLPSLSVVHSAAPSAGAPGSLFEVRVTITNNTGAAIDNVKYVRVMDWDIPLTEFNEFVTIRGTATTTFLEFSNDQGFASANPLAANPPEIAPGTTNVDFTDSGPADHGAFFRFNFGTIASGDSFEFSIFYGAASSEAAALSALAAVGAELYSLGQSSPPSGSPTAGTPATFIFGFADVGGTPVAVPIPGSLPLVALGLLVAGVVRRRRV